MAATEFQLHPTVWDPTWSRLPEPEEIGGLNSSQPQFREDWVVRLRFKQNGDLNSGTGFYLNVPDAEWYVILTAAHNLVDEHGNRSEELHVERHGKDPILPASLEPIICPDYQPSTIDGKPKGATASIDYGVLRTPRPRGAPNIGFGFALKLSQEDLSGKNLELSGYLPREEKKQKSQKAELDCLDVKSGPCWVSQENSLEYDMDTAQGLSGSPIYMPYKGHETVVAIHNNGRARPGKGSKGARLSCATIKQIFDWVGLTYRGKSVRASDSSDVDPLYLHFIPDEDYAWVHLSKRNLDTCFDVFPAYAPTSRLNTSMLYVFRYVDHPTQGERSNRHYWVLWDVVRQGVTLTESLQEYCFPRLVRKASSAGIFWIVLPISNGASLPSLMELRMDPKSITPLDLQMGEVDGSGVSFSKHIKNKVDKENYNRFCLE